MNCIWPVWCPLINSSLNSCAWWPCNGLIMSWIICGLLAWFLGLFPGFSLRSILSFHDELMTAYEQTPEGWKMQLRDILKTHIKKKYEIAIIRFKSTFRLVQSNCCVEKLIYNSLKLSIFVCPTVPSSGEHISNNYFQTRKPLLWLVHINNTQSTDAGRWHLPAPALTQHWTTQHF